MGVLFMMSCGGGVRVTTNLDARKDLAVKIIVIIVEGILRFLLYLHPGVYMGPLRSQVTVSEVQGALRYRICADQVG